MRRVLLFARTYHQAKNFLYDIDPVARKDYVVVLANRYLHGHRAESAVFLEDWWRDWNPVEANEICTLLYFLYGVEGMWEQVDMARRRYARGLYGLRTPYEPEFMWFDLQVRDRGEDNWISSDTRARYSQMLRDNRTLCALPGLDDKKRTVKPFLDRHDGWAHVGIMSDMGVGVDRWVENLMLVVKSKVKADADRPISHD